MSKFKRRKKPDEIRFRLAMILVERNLCFYEAHKLAHLIYADVVAPEVDNERKMWEELNRAKESGELS